MELALLKLFAFLRPILWINVETSMFGMSVFEVGAIVFTGLLAVAIFTKAALQKELRLSAIDFVLLLLSLWCIAVFLIYIEYSEADDLAKLVIPFFTYIVAKNIIVDRQQYLKIIFLMILGTSIPVVISVALIVQGKSIDMVNYYTGLPRYSGAYASTHNMAHSVTIAIMLVVLYITLAAKNISAIGVGMSTGRKVFFGAFVAMALFCVYMSYVRTALLGLFLFTFLYVFFWNKKYFAAWMVASVIGIVIAAPILLVIFEDVFRIFEGQESVDQLGSGRLSFWMDNLKVFANASIDRQLAGLGIGNRIEIMNSHNDFVHVFVETGIVGFILFMTVQVLFLKAILNIEGKEKYVFISIFLAIAFMNFLSNSYVTRIAIAQIYYIMMTYVELPKGEQMIVRKSSNSSEKSIAPSFRQIPKA